jgi:predicted RecB family nuclease
MALERRAGVAAGARAPSPRFFAAPRGASARLSGGVLRCRVLAGPYGRRGVASEAGPLSETQRGLSLSASALSGFFECQHHTWQELRVARGERQRPGENEIERLLLERRGRAHELRVLALYEQRGLSVVKLSSQPLRGPAERQRAAEETQAAMQVGADVIYQGTLLDGEWSGRPDFLIKVSAPSRFGTHGYEVVDAKLAQHAQARALIQLCVYTDQLERLQWAAPEHFWIAIGGAAQPSAAGELAPALEPLRLRSADYLAYYRRARARFEAFVNDDAAKEPYPEPVEYCDVCRYWQGCETRRRTDDHTSLVAGITRRQRDRLASVDVNTTSALAGLAPDQVIEGIDSAPLSRIRAQASLQVAARGEERPRYELFETQEPGAGLQRLPAPTPGDLFLDLEGDAYVLGGGLDYLFGLVELGEPSFGWSRREAPGEPRYNAHWASNHAEEKRAFEAVVRRIGKGRSEFPELHVYHFGHREPDALKKLSCRHGSLEAEVDQLLREHVLVDLHSVLRQSLRASVEGYTLKQLEGLYGFTRGTERRAAAKAMQLFGWWLETGEGEDELPARRQTIQAYNEEDCLSAWRMRDWLEERRVELETKSGRRLERPALDAEAKGPKEERSAEVAALVEELRQGLAEDPREDEPEQRARRVLSHLVSWHWRELKSSYWEYFQAKELLPSERLEDRLVLDGLSYEGVVAEVAQSLVHRYRFPEQEHAIRRTPGAEDPETGKAVRLLELGPSHVDIKRGRRSREEHPRSLIPGRPLSYDAQEKSLLALAQSVVRRGLAADVTDFPSARALLLRSAPACGQAPGAPLLGAAEDTVEGVVRLALALDRSVLAVQGPPGSGKTHRAAAAIVALIGAGKRVGVTANSHHVIKSLLRKCLQAAAGAKLGAHHIHEPDPELDAEEAFTTGKDYGEIRAGLASGAIALVGGTTFAWSRSDLQSSVDVLVVDEAAQVSLANVLAAAAAAPSLILFGDPAQLEQPQRGVHPAGAGVSALEYLMGENRLTLPPELGVFLPETRRLHPNLCTFTSSVFYEGRLRSLPGLEQQSILGAGEFSGSGLCYVPLIHHGNTNRSDEEVEAIAGLVEQLMAGGASYRDARGASRPLQPRDVLVVAPYNAQVAALRRRLPPAVPVGTVDKFQGQEAPIVIYSMTSSSAADAPRGFEFLYSLNRLNVATSRAQARVILVASPELATAQCRTPRQMQLVNALCTYLELAAPVALRERQPGQA